ncbi:TPA: hypothetical protein SLN72_000169 [Morganella morganii]|nr:hypothetical protein [Morganella morganii]
MLNTTEKITYRNEFMHNGIPVDIETIRPIFDGRRAAALSVWEQYEQAKSRLRMRNLTPEQYQNACRDIADALGV